MVKKDVLELTFSKVPMFKALLLFGLGIILGKFFYFPFVAYFPIVILVLFLLLILSQLKNLIRFRKYLFTISYYSLMFSLGIWLISVRSPIHSKNHFSHYENSLQLVGIVDDEPVYKEKSIRFPLRVIAAVDSSQTFHTIGRVMVTVLRDSSKSQFLEYGDQLIFKNKIAPPNGAMNPKEFDYKKYLANKGIWHQVFLTADDYKINAKNEGNFILAKSLMIRQGLIDKFGDYIHYSEAYQIAIALLFGYRSQIDVSTLDAFTNTGTIHVLSVSGLHVSLVFGLLTFVLCWLDRFRLGKYIRGLIIFVTVWVYVILTGMSPPILRAGIMISFFILSTMSGRRQISVNTVLASAFFILLINPFYLFDVGFQLSYAAILGILLLYPQFCDIWLPTNKWVRYVVEYCYVSIAAQLFTMPLALYYFGQFPAYFLLANLFIAIPSTVVMYLGIALALIPFDFINVILGYLLNWVLLFCVNGLKIIAQLPLSVYKGIIWDGYQALLLSIILTFFLLSLNYRNKRFLFYTLTITLLFSFYTSWINIRFQNYTGGRIYNVRSDIAIATIDKGRVTLFSSLDSINHSTVRFSILPDLCRFTDEKNINFVSLNDSSRSNYKINIGKRRFLVLERKMDVDCALSSDYVLLRKNIKVNLNDFRKQNQQCNFIIDGSNSVKYIDKLNSMPEVKSNLYTLKNNFAYVWDGE